MTHPDEPTQQPDTIEAEPASHEAAKYRVRLREVESDVEALTAQLAAAHKGLIDYQLASTGVKPDLFWAVTNPHDLLDDGGNLDATQVAAAITKARAVAIQPARQGGTAGLRSGSMPPQPAPNRFVDAFKPPTER